MTNRAKTAVRLALLAMVCFGCYDTTVNNPVFPDGGTDTDTDTDSDSDGDTDLEWDTEFDGDTDQCDQVIGEYNTNVYNGYAGSVESQIHVQVFEGQPNDPGFESIMMLYLVNGQPGEVADLTGESDWATCTRCLFYLTDCPDDDFSHCTVQHTVTSGTLQIGEMDPVEPWDNFLEFVVTDVVLQSCSVDWEGGATDINSDGPTICIGAWHVALMLDYG
jgi:hypothetical protein